MKISSMQHPHLHSVPSKENEQVDPSDNDLIELFPLPRYFQVHFQHIHDNAEFLRKEVSQLKHYTACVEAKLDTLLNLLDASPKRPS